MRMGNPGSPHRTDFPSGGVCAATFFLIYASHLPPGLLHPAPSCSAVWLYPCLTLYRSICVHILASDLEVPEGRICGCFALFLPLKYPYLFLLPFILPSPGLELNPALEGMMEKEQPIYPVQGPGRYNHFW